MSEFNLFSSGKNEKGPDVNTKGSNRTTCTVFIDTHDKGKHQDSQRINLSEYITQVSISQHLTGGGSANIMLPAIDHIEDYISAGDLVNIYFNLNRADVDAYNIGNVRTFFGYVETVHKGVSVGGDGAKRTNYTINCIDFSKAFRSTQVYNNPHLTSQGDSDVVDVIRADLGHNLGGLALHSKGIATSGTPRQLIIRNMARMLGMGAQWILPMHYNENKIKGAQWGVRLKKDEKTREVDKAGLKFMAIGRIQTSWSTKGADENHIVDEKILLKEGLGAVLGELDKKTITELQSFLGGVEDIKYNVYTGVVEAKSDKTSMDIGNTLFEIGPIKPADPDSNWPTPVSLFDKEMPSSDNSNTNVHKTPNLKNDIQLTMGDVATEIAGLRNFDQTAKVNHTPTPGAETKLAKTLFNILSLDYLEDVDGLWGSFAFMEFQGSLWEALESSANTVVNEFFMDLRPVADFVPREKDGLGAQMKGGMPMVPAVILREKPFTNYLPPGSEIALPKTDKGITVGGIKEAGEDLPGDQLFVSMMGPHESITNVSKKSVKSEKYAPSLNLSPDKATTIFNYALIAARLKSIAKKIQLKRGYAKFFDADNIKTFLNTKQTKLLQAEKDNVDKAFTDLLNNLNKLNKDKKKKLAKDTTIDALDISFLNGIFGAEAVIKFKGEEVIYLTDQHSILQEKAVGTIFSLPRPVFRTPDETRVVLEKSVGSNVGIMGYETVGGKDLKSFTAFEAEQSAISPEEALAIGGEGKDDVRNVLGVGKKSIKDSLAKAKKDRWHILDSVTVRAQDVISHQYSRGDGNIINFLEIFANLPGGIEAQRFFFNNFLPIVTPIHVHRFGVRLASHQTKFVQHYSAVGTPFQLHGILLTRWAMLLDMWYQHNHEYLSGTMSLRGLPGIRPGYRLDRSDLNLSFYVEGVSHTWTYPGALRTSVTVTRGQPLASKNNTKQVLPYYSPEPMTASDNQQRQQLGTIFSANTDKKGKKQPIPGTYTGPSGAEGLGIKPRPGEEEKAGMIEEFFDSFFDL